MLKARYFLFFPALIFFSFVSFAQNSNKIANATRIKTPPKIDGLLNDSVWQKAEIAGGFRQYQPYWDSAAYQKTEVRILYDDNAVYVGAMMWDTAPDSVLRQLGNRDNNNLNADAFTIEFDTYNNQNDAYTFQVWASGVQYDYRHNDATYNAVWQSATKITKNGWSLEMKIPYSALRFPTSNVQTWGLEMSRYIRRIRETDAWALPKTGATNVIAYWGKLIGITNIRAPLRLSFTPYISVYGEHYPYDVAGKSNYSESFSAGLDLKYGFNESFTLDMTLLPDFSQVQSDNQVKNLTAFETVYDEQRPFFKEAVDLFELGGLFYSRRIGHQPLKYDSIESLSPGITIERNPEQTKLLNATKISGRNKHGLAIGFFNAITDNMYAEIKDSLGNKKKILTDPITNYNIIVINQAMKHNSSFYLINTNVARDKGYDDANVTGTGLNLIDRTNTWMFSAAGALSQVLQKSGQNNKAADNAGFKYTAGFSKISGNFHYGLSRTALNSKFNDNDLGLTLYNNYNSNNLSLSYTIYKPFWRILGEENSLSITHATNFTTGKPIQSDFVLKNDATDQNHITWINNTSGSFQKVYDYYEPRVAGRYYISPAYFCEVLAISTDYRKTFAMDVQGLVNTEPAISRNEHGISISPRVRASDHLLLIHSFQLDAASNDVGYAAIDSAANIIFGNRNLVTITNTFTGTYIFKNDLSLSLVMRHYWSKGRYNKYFTLDNNGHLTDNPDYTQDNDFNFNSFNIDLDFNWQFAPGSNLSIVWKNAILHQDQVIMNDFFDDFNRTFRYQQTNSISLKVLYYLDYQYLKKKKG